MQLTLLEKASLEQAGTQFLTVAHPASEDRDDVLYPQGVQINKDRGSFNWLAEPGNEYWPLPAGFGRYMMLGACGNLKTSQDGHNYCGAYEKRPEVCRDFEEAGPKCQLMRAVKVDITKKLRS